MVDYAFAFLSVMRDTECPFIFSPFKLDFDINENDSMIYDFCYYWFLFPWQSWEVSHGWLDSFFSILLNLDHSTGKYKKPHTDIRFHEIFEHMNSGNLGRSIRVYFLWFLWLIIFLLFENFYKLGNYHLEFLIVSSFCTVFQQLLWHPESNITN